MIAIFDYGETQLIFEVRGLASKPYAGAGQGVGNTLHFEAGMVGHFPEKSGEDAGRRRGSGLQFLPKGSDKPEPLVKIDYKLDVRAREFKILEIEPHFQFWHLLGAYA